MTHKFKDSIDGICIYYASKEETILRPFNNKAITKRKKPSPNISRAKGLASGHYDNTTGSVNMETAVANNHSGAKADDKILGTEGENEIYVDWKEVGNDSDDTYYERTTTQSKDTLKKIDNKDILRR